MGSWPILPVTEAGGQSVLLPRVLQSAARIVGVRKETTSGFAVQGEQFYLWVDVGGAPTQFPVAFVGAGNLSLDDVIDQINTAVSPHPPVAFRDNGFLRLESPNAGEDSYLRLQTDVGSDVFFELGLFAETVARGGYLESAISVDPDRQIAMPEQLSWMEGEQFEARVFNRMAFQLGVNTDRNEGLLSKKRIVEKAEHSVLYSPAGTQGVQLYGHVYVGDTVAPTKEQLERLFAVLDGDKREVTQEKQVVQNGTGLTDFSVDPDNGNTTATSLGGYSFSSNDAELDRYLVVQNFTGGAAVLNNQPLKIIRYIDASNAVISPIDPTDGSIIDVSGQTGRTASHIRIDTLKCRVVGAYDSPGGTRIEGVKDPKHTGLVPTRVELGNRIVFSGEDLTFPAVVSGDVVTWSGHGVGSPYSNNGEYRVARVIDAETVELVDSDWGPVYLNPDLVSGAIGTVGITTDGEFWDSPFIEFDTSATGGLPTVGEYVHISYGKMSTFRAATDDPALFFGHGTLYDQEVDSSVQKALLFILGPSATSIDDWTLQDRNANLESLHLRLNQEHYDHDGRHSTIRPDVIDMYPDVYGTTVHLRSAPGGGEYDTEKLTLTNFLGTEDFFSVWGDGAVWSDKVFVAGIGFGVGLERHFASGTPFDKPPEAFSAGVDEKVVFEMGTPGSLSAVAYTSPSTSPPAGTYRYQVCGVDADGEVGAPGSYQDVTVNGSQYVALQWNHVPGAETYQIWRRLSGSWYKRTISASGLATYTFEDYNQAGWVFDSVGPLLYSLYSDAWGTKFTGGDHTSWVGQRLSVNRAPDLAALNVSVNPDESWAVLLQRSGGYTLQGTGPSLEGYNSPRTTFALEEGASTVDAILDQTFWRFNGSTWSNKHSVRYYDDYVAYQDPLLDQHFIISHDDGGFIKVYNTGTTNPALIIDHTYGPHIKLQSNTGDVIFGTRDAGNFYIDHDGAGYFLISNLGNVMINSSNADNANSSWELYVYGDTYSSGAIQAGTTLAAGSTVTAGTTLFGVTLDVSGDAHVRGGDLTVYGTGVHPGITLSTDQMDGGIDSYEVLKSWGLHSSGLNVALESATATLISAGENGLASAITTFGIDTSTSETLYLSADAHIRCFTNSQGSSSITETLYMDSDGRSVFRGRGPNEDRDLAIEANPLLYPSTSDLPRYCDIDFYADTMAYNRTARIRASSMWTYGYEYSSALVHHLLDLIADTDWNGHNPSPGWYSGLANTSFVRATSNSGYFCINNTNDANGLASEIIFGPAPWSESTIRNKWGIGTLCPANWEFSFADATIVRFGYYPSGRSQAWYTSDHLYADSSGSSGYGEYIGSTTDYFGRVYQYRNYYKVAATTFDDVDDLALIDAYSPTDKFKTVKKNGIERRINIGAVETVPWPMLAEPAHPNDRDRSPWVDGTDATFFMLGAIKQLHGKHKDAVAQLESKIAELQAKLEVLTCPAC
jgi:hypothetical protein